MLTTSRQPTMTIRTFCHDLARAVPNVIRISRGKMSLDGLAEKALEVEANRVIVVDRWHGGVGKIQFFHVKPSGLAPVAPIIYVLNVKPQREFGHTRLKQTKLLAIQKSSQNPVEVDTAAQSLSELLSVPIMSAEEAASKGFEALMQISLNISNRIQINFLQLPTLIETGPCVTVKHLIWEAGGLTE